MKRALLALLSAAGLLVLSNATAQATPEQDQQLVDAMDSVGVELWENAPYNAIKACAILSTGLYSPTELAYGVWEGNPTWTYAQSAVFITSSVAIYCPPTAGE